MPPKFTLFTLIDDAFYKLTGRSVYEFDSYLVWSVVTLIAFVGIVGVISLV